MTIKNILIILAFLYAGCEVSAQRAVSAIGTNTNDLPPASINNVKGAGIRHADNTLRSAWDSVGFKYDINYNVGTNNIQSVTQFNVVGSAKTFISLPVNALVKLRRKANAYVNDTRSHFNFWSVHTELPQYDGDDFKFIAPEVVSQEAALISNNINSGYDNIFSNSINSLHASNIERIDFIMPAGLTPFAYDIDNAGVIVIDRGVGDPFKVAAITALDAQNNPTAFGPLVSVTAANFGPNLLASNFNYCIITHDPKYGNKARPSAPDNQNLRGVFFTLGDLGITANQRFYGYALFGQDVMIANPNWNTYPDSTSANSLLDPINVMTFFKEVNSLLPVSMTYKLYKQNNKPQIRFTIHEAAANKAVAIEKSFDGKNFNQIDEIEITDAKEYLFNDNSLLTGKTYYRLRLVSRNGAADFTDVKAIEPDKQATIHISPIPAKNFVTISLPTSWQQEQLSIAMISSDGMKYLQKEFASARREERFYFNNAKPGVYFLHITNLSTNQSEVRSLVVH